MVGLMCRGSGRKVEGSRTFGSEKNTPEDCSKVLSYNSTSQVSSDFGELRSLRFASVRVAQFQPIEGELADGVLRNSVQTEWNIREARERKVSSESPKDSGDEGGKGEIREFLASPACLSPFRKSSRSTDRTTRLSPIVVKLCRMKDMR
eukprot:767662-Hanusia_phi.AAC.14